MKKSNWGQLGKALMGLVTKGILTKKQGVVTFISSILSPLVDAHKERSKLNAQLKKTFSEYRKTSEIRHERIAALSEEAFDVLERATTTLRKLPNNQRNTVVKMIRQVRGSFESGNISRIANATSALDDYIKQVPTSADTTLTPKTSVVPSDVQKQSSTEQGGKVVFGKYYDRNGKHLGSVIKGKWVPVKSNT